MKKIRKIRILDLWLRENAQAANPRFKGEAVRV